MIIDNYPLESAVILAHLRHVTTAAMSREETGVAWLCNELGALLDSQGELAAARPYYERALAIYEDRLGVDHPTTRTVRANLAALDQPSQRGEEQIAEIAQQAEAAVASALAEGDAEVRAALAEQLEARAQWAGLVDDTLSPDEPQLREQSRSSAPGCTDAPDGSTP